MNRNNVDFFIWNTKEKWYFKSNAPITNIEMCLSRDECKICMTTVLKVLTDSMYQPQTSAVSYIIHEYGSADNSRVGQIQYEL